MKKACLLTICCVFALAFNAKADITYTMITGNGVAGTITTDGHTGPLGFGDILNWNLNLNDGTTTLNLNGSNSTLDNAVGDLSATPGKLTFNFSGTDGDYLLFQEDAFHDSGFHYFCLANVGGPCFSQVQTVAPDDYLDAIITPFSGDVVIATASTPEPTAEILLPMMLMGVAFVARKRITRQA